jgi:hypothetical protein
MNRRNLFLILLSLGVVMAITVYGIGGNWGGTTQTLTYDGPVHLRYADARLTGGNGSAIMVAYETNETMAKPLTSNETYLIHERTGTILHVEYVYKIGYLESFSIVGEYNRGWFMVHNYDRMVNAGDLVTICIGDAVIEHYPITPSKLAAV